MTGQVPSYDLRQANGDPVTTGSVGTVSDTEFPASPTKPKRSWVRIVLIILLLLFVAGAMSKCLDAVKDTKSSSPPVVSSATPAAPATTPPTPTPPAKPAAATLNLSMDDILARYNATAKELKIPVVKKRDIKASPSKDGDINRVAQVTLSKHTSAIFSFDLKTDRLKSVTVIAVGDGSKASGNTIAFSLLSMVSAVTPDLAPDERGAVLEALNITGDNSFRGKWADASRRMTTATPEGMGIWMSTEFE